MEELLDASAADPEIRGMMAITIGSLMVDV
jgi:hypothetical protein